MLMQETQIVFLASKKWIKGMLPFFFKLEWPEIFQYVLIDTDMCVQKNLNFKPASQPTNQQTNCLQIQMPVLCYNMLNDYI